jgi:hypothetical protein
VPDSAQHTFWVYLSLRNSKALDAAIAAASNPAGAGYGKYLTPDQFRAGYAPTDADVAAVRAYLRQSGFTVSADRPDNNRWVKASGTTAQVERAFETQLRTYQHRGKTLEAPSGDLSIARSISSRIAGIAGLDGSDRLMRPDTADAPPAPAFVNAPPCSTSWGEKSAVDDEGNPTVPPAYGPQFLPYATCGYTPNQLQGAYGTKARSQGASTATARRWRSSPSCRTPTSTPRPTASRRWTSARSRPRIAPTIRSAAPTSATRRAGTARRPSTSRPCTRWRPAPTCSSWAAPTASTSRSSTRSTRSSTAGWPRSSRTPTATSARPVRTPACARPGTTPSARPPWRASGCTTRRATAATRPTTSATPRPTSRPRTRWSPPWAAPRWA